MRARYALLASLVLLAIAAAHRWEAALTLRNWIGAITYHVEYAGFPFPYLEMWLASPSGRVEYVEVLTAYLIVDEVVLFSLSYLILVWLIPLMWNARGPSASEQR